MRTNLLKKISIFTISTLFSILTLEISLNLFLNYFASSKVYSPFITKSSKVKEEGKEYRQDDLYELFPSRNKDSETICIGDSFTSGGNVKWSETYPSFLYNMQKKEKSIHNMGLCEDTTRGVYNRLVETSLDWKSSKNTSRNLIVLVGAADIFSEFRVGNKKSFNMKSKILEEERWFSNLKTVKMVKFVFNELQIRLSEEKVDYNEYKYKDDVVDVKSCYSSSSDLNGKNDCLIKKISAIDIKNAENNPIFVALKNVIVHEERPPYISQPKSDIVHDLLIVLDQHPISLRDVIFDIVYKSLAQSQYSLSDILSRLEEAKLRVFKKNKNLNNQFDQANKAIAKLKVFIKDRDKAKKARDMYWKKIIGHAKKFNMNLIMMTYPLKYVELNNQLRKIAHANKIQLIDLEKIFEHLVKSKIYKTSELVEDWEHCTPLGYEIIAKEVHKILSTQTK